MLSTRRYFAIAAIALFHVSCQSQKTNFERLRTTLLADASFLASDDLEGRRTGTAGETKAASYIVKRFESIGLSPKGTEGYRQRYEVTPTMNPHELPKIGSNGDSLDIISNNIVGMIDNPGDEIVIVGAHYDHLGYGGVSSLHRGDSSIHNGADDNASGVAVLMLLAELLKEVKMQKDILFIAFSGEEEGLWGSNYYSKNPTVDLAKVSAMINMDMVGKLDDRRTLVIHGIGTSPSWEPMVNDTNLDSLNLILQSSGVGPSDHTSFYLQDIPVLHFFTGQHEDYHRPSDDAEKLNYEGMVEITEMIKRIVKELDKKEKLAFTKTKDESRNTPRFTVTLGVVPDYLFGGVGMRIDGISEGRPAQAAGLKKGDIVTKLGEFEIADMNSYMVALAHFKKGDETIVTVQRDQSSLPFSIKF